MDLVTKFSSQKKSYCESITPSKYEQCIDSTIKSSTDKSFSTLDQSNNISNTVISYNDISILFIGLFDPTSSIIEKKDFPIYSVQLLIDIATKIDEQSDTNYDKFNYNKYMNSTLIQQGLQSKNNISSLLYLSDYYGVSTNVYIASSKLKIRTCDKNRKELNIIYHQGKFTDLSESVTTINDSYKEGTFKDLGECFVLDTPTKDVYKKYLQPIGKYKVSELTELAIERGISLDSSGKKKIKKQLYDDINVYELNKT